MKRSMLLIGMLRFSCLCNWVCLLLIVWSDKKVLKLTVRSGTKVSKERVWH